MSTPTAKFINRDGRLVMSRLTTVVEQGDRTFDIEFWQQQTDEQRMQAVWDLAVFDWEMRGRNADELRLQRSVECLRRN